MGLAESMNANMKKNMQAQMAFQKELILKQRQAQLAMQVALGRERLKYFAVLCSFAIPAAIVSALRKKDPRFLGPIVPLSLMLAFQYDMCYGTMLERARDQADQLIVDNPYKFYLPEHSGIVSTEEYERILGIKQSIKQKI